MELLRALAVHCPYCGEPIEIAVDCSVETQCYVEDCQVCCRPIVMDVHVDAAGEPTVDARREDD